MICSSVLSINKLKSHVVICLSSMKIPDDMLSICNNFMCPSHYAFDL